jgi:DNA-binding SARP family transcriptional activator
LQFALLGPLDVWDGDRSLVPGPAKHRALLAALLLTPNQMVPFGRLVAVLWGEQPPASAAPVLRVYVSGLRRLLGQERIRTAAGGYLIAVAPEQVDLHRFEGLATRAQRARDAGRLDEASELFRTALGLWRGPALADVESDELQRVEAVRIEELRLKTLEDRLDLDLERGRHREVIGELRQLVASFPLRERPWAQLMLALHRSGRRAEALEVYQEARRTLVAELGLEPGEELRQLHQKLLVDDPTLSGPRQPSPAAAPSAAPRELPPDVPDFTGRQDALAWTREAVEASGSAPLHIVFHGQPGVGKTALALHAATALGSRFPDGQLYADLRGAGSAPVEAAAVLAGFLRSLGCPDSAVPAGFADRLGRYRSLMAGKRLLIVLDNAASEAQVRPLLPATPGSVALVTSRSPLAGLEGGQSYELDVLPAAHAVELLDRVVGQQRVRAELQAAQQVVALCGQLPLALRIAGARLARRPSWSLSHLAGRLEDERHRLDELQAGDLAVRGSIGFGYQSLAPGERGLFRRLGLLSAADFAAWVAAPLLGDSAESATRLVESLADASLLEPLSPDPAGQERYRLHDLTRLYARERFDQEEGDPGEVLGPGRRRPRRGPPCLVAAGAERARDRGDPHPDPAGGAAAARGHP